MATTDPPELGRLRTAFRADRASDDPEADLRAMVFVLDLQEAQPGFVRLRDWAMARLAPVEGETAVDVGCGAGAVVRALAGRVGPRGRAVGVEPNPGLRRVAQQRSAGTWPAPEIVDGDAYALPFEDESVDVLHCERVWQHLADPARAAREVARVLRPGGRAAVLDSDWATMVVEPADPDVLRRVNQRFWDASPNPFSGRRLRGLLRDAGLVVDPDIGSSASVMPDAALREWGSAWPALSDAVRSGAVSAAEAETWARCLRAAVDRGSAFASVTMFAVVARG